MRIRTIKPSFWKSLSIADLSLRARLHFIGLWNYADDEGRGVDSALLLKGELWPLEPSVGLKTVEQLQVELALKGRIVRYAVSGRRFFEIVNWSEHQSISHPYESTIPPVADPEATLFDPGEFQFHSGNGTGTFQGERKGKERKREREGKGESGAPAPRRRDPGFDALARAEGSDPRELTADAKKAVGVAIAKIRQASPEVTPDEIQRRAENYPTHFGDAALTANALARHWAKCGNPANGRVPRVSRQQKARARIEGMARG